MKNPFRPGLRYLTDSGLETTLVFSDGRTLPAFAAYVLLDEVEGRERLRAWYSAHATVANAHDLGFVFETPTWRASPDWGAVLGHDRATLDRLNRAAVSLMREIAGEFAGMPSLVSGQIGPRADGYVPGIAMAIDEAAGYHSQQLRALAGADIVTAMKMTNAAEATGVALAADILGIPVVVSFTVEADGRLPSGQPLGEAIDEVDSETDGTVLHYVVNCARPEHFAGTLRGPAVLRIGGVRSNASLLSQAGLHVMDPFDEGDARDLGRSYAQVAAVLPRLIVFGGCCGTDQRHAARIAAAVAQVRERAE